MNAHFQVRNISHARAIIPVAPRALMPTFDLLDVSGRFPALADLVEDVSNWDIPDDNLARTVAVKVLPSTMLHLVVQYRTSTLSTRTFGQTTRPHPKYRHVVTTVQTGFVTVGSPGPLGLVVVRLKPEAAASLLGDRLYAFADTKIELGAVFGAGPVESLEVMLAGAKSSGERIDTVLRFLQARIRPYEPDPVVCRAAATLRHNPLLRLAPLAVELGLSERHLIRRFKAMFGMGPKRFARSARVERVFAASSSGSSWASIACACGFADQAHMIHDFKSILGVTPTDVFARARLDGGS
jgi:AraC-like DNA-binding protein